MSKRERHGGGGLSGGGGGSEEGGEALRGRGRGRQCTEIEGNKPTTAAKGGRRSSNKGKRRNKAKKHRNIGHARGKEFLYPKKRDPNAVVSSCKII